MSCFRSFIGHRCHKYHRADIANAVPEIRFLSRRGSGQKGVPSTHPFQGYHKCRGNRILWRSQGKYNITFLCSILDDRKKQILLFVGKCW